MGFITMGANNGIRFIRPAHGCLNRVIKAQTDSPELARRRILAGPNMIGEARGPLESCIVRFPVNTAQHLFRNARIPDVVQVQVARFPFYMDAVSALSNVFGVQGLVDVADEMNYELRRLVPPPGPQLRI